MSNSNGANSLARSLNGIITYDDGSGTVIENGTIKTNNLALNTISAEYPTKDCDIWSNNTGSTYYSAYATGPVYFGLGSTSNINLGPIATMPSAGNFNLATSSAFTGLINLGHAGAIGSKIKLLSPIVECPVAPTIGNSVVNKTYADGLSTSDRSYTLTAIATAIANLLNATNIWTGISNTFQQMIYANAIQGIGASNLNVGSGSGTLGLVGKGMAITAYPTGDINISATAGVVAIEDLKIDGNNIQSISGGINLAASTGDINITTTLGAVNISPKTAITIQVASKGPINLNGVSYFANNNVATTRSDYASWGGTQMSWNRSNGAGETNIISYQAGGSDGGVTIANVNTAGTYKEILACKNGGIACQVNLRANSGLSFGKGNLTSATFMQTYSTGFTGIQILANTIITNSWTITFASVGLANFSTAPIVTASVICATPNSTGVIVQVAGTLTTGVVFLAYNSKASTALANTWGISFIAVGGY